ncbi:MAG: glycosyltransferase family 4 protein [Patescibacteria group bacterium]
MKILIFTTAYLPFVGGAELAIKEITERLSPLTRGALRLPSRRRGVSFTLITARFRRALPKRERIGAVEVYRVGWGCFCDKWFLPLRAFRLAGRLERKEHFDVVWSMMASQASIAAAWFKKAFPDKRLALTLQEGDEEGHLKRYVFGNDFLYRLLILPRHLSVFKRADVITAISHYLAERARRNNPRAPVAVIPNGVNLERFKMYDLRFKKEELKQKLGLKLEDKVVITTSRLVEKNGIGDLIEAMHYLPEHVRLLVLGSGPLEKSLKLKTSSLKLANRVRFAGHIPHEQLPQYLHIADVFCRPSLSEGMGTSFIEAMAAGVPVVATAVGGIPDFLHDPSFPRTVLGSGERTVLGKQTGLFCEVGSPKSIAEKISLLLSDDTLREMIVRNASKMVMERYDWDGIAEKMATAFGD